MRTIIGLLLSVVYMPIRIVIRVIHEISEWLWNLDGRIGRAIRRFGRD